MFCQKCVKLRISIWRTLEIMSKFPQSLGTSLNQGSTVWGCVQRLGCALTLSPPPPSFPPAHVLPSSLSLIICKCIHLHLRSLCIKADIKVQKRNNIVFCFSIDYTNSPFPHYCEHMHHLWAWVDNKKNENTEICKYQIIW